MIQLLNQSHSQKIVIKRKGFSRSTFQPYNIDAYKQILLERGIPFEGIEDTVKKIHFCASNQYLINAVYYSLSFLIAAVVFPILNLIRYGEVDGDAWLMDFSIVLLAVIFFCVYSTLHYIFGVKKSNWFCEQLNQDNIHFNCQLSFTFNLIIEFKQVLAPGVTERDPKLVCIYNIPIIFSDSLKERSNNDEIRQFYELLPPTVILILNQFYKERQTYKCLQLVISLLCGVGLCVLAIILGLDDIDFLKELLIGWLYLFFVVHYVLLFVFGKCFKSSFMKSFELLQHKSFEVKEVSLISLVIYEYSSSTSKSDSCLI